MLSANQRRRSAVRHWIRRLSVRFTVFSYTVLAPFGYVGFTLLALACHRDEALRIRRMQRMTVAAYRFMHDWLRLADIARFDHRQPLEGLPRGPYVAIANHPCSMDITALFALLGGGCTIVKSSVFRRRLLRRLLASAGHIEGPGNDLFSIGRIVDAAVQRLQQGFSLVVFPEGTRSPDHGLKRFGRTAFEIARRARVPLVSIAIECEPLYLSKGVPLFRPPHPTPALRVRILAVDEPASFGSDSKLMLQRAEGRYRYWLEGRTYSSTSAPASNWKVHPCRIS